MSAKDLLGYWAVRDNSRLTSKQVSVRLPTNVAARISALCDIYSSKTKTQIIGDLLSSALDEIQESMSYELSEDSMQIYPDSNERVHKILGPGTLGPFLDKSNKYLKELESELGNDEPELFNVADYHSGDEYY